MLLAAFQEKKKMMEEKMPKGSGSQRLFQQVPHQFCNAVCRVGFHRLYSTHNGRYRACPWGLSVFRACPWGLSSGLPTCAQASRHQWMAVGRILHPWASETKSFRNGHSFVFSVFCLWAILGCDYGQQDLWFWFFSPFCFCVLAFLSTENTMMHPFLTFLISTKLSIPTPHSLVRSLHLT